MNPWTVYAIVWISVSAAATITAYFTRSAWSLMVLWLPLFISWSYKKED